MAWTTFFFLRIAYQIFLPSEFENQDTETMTEKILMAVLLGVIILAGIFPNPAFSLFSNLIRGFDVLIR
jgi:NADH:ubiquinone oxidoreductase subunit 2 (subunit N)